MHSLRQHQAYFHKMKSGSKKNIGFMLSEKEKKATKERQWDMGHVCLQCHMVKSTDGSCFCG